MTIQEAVLRRVDQLLRERNMTRYALCKKVAMPQSTLQHLYNSDQKSLNFNTIILFAEGFDMEVAEFLSHPLFLHENIETN
ncbi:MAG: helix-turn-helix transcriptional regulator [Christensenellaceae bacterium]|jgi:predicted transcriptional regulator|nr:helix-turn-helix transcriptional regulator [Christensenellaceae bacterium]